MIRKVNLIGPSSLMISLPSKWVRRLQVKKGDEIEVKEKGNSLVVGKTLQVDKMRLKLDIELIGTFNKNLISDAYKAGYDEVEVKGLTPQVFEAIQERVVQLLGYEIMEHGEKQCVIRMISKEIEGEFESMLRKTFINLLEMSRECALNIERKQKEQLANVRNLERSNNKYTDFCMRILNKYGAKDPAQTTFLYCIVRDLEKTGDQYKYLCDIFLRQKTIEISKEVLTFFKAINNFFELFYSLFYAFDQTKIKAFYEQRENLIEQGQRLVKSKNQQEVLIIYHLLMLRNLIFDLFGPYFGMKILQNVDE